MGPSLTFRTPNSQIWISCNETRVHELRSGWRDQVADSREGGRRVRDSAAVGHMPGDHLCDRAREVASSHALTLKHHATHDVAMLEHGVDQGELMFVTQRDRGWLGPTKATAGGALLNARSWHPSEQIEHSGGTLDLEDGGEHGLDLAGVGGVDVSRWQAHCSGSVRVGTSGAASETLRTAVPDVKNSSVCAPHIHSLAAHSTPVIPSA